MAGNTESYGVTGTSFFLTKTDGSGIVPEFSVFTIILLPTGLMALVALQPKGTDRERFGRGI